MDKKIELLVEQAGNLSYDAAAQINGGEATLAQTAAVLLQSQISVLVSLIYEGDKIHVFWEDVIKVIQMMTAPAQDNLETS